MVALSLIDGILRVLLGLKGPAGKMRARNLAHVRESAGGVPLTARPCLSA